MKVKLKTDFWQMKEFDMSVEKNALNFTNGTEKLNFPLCAVRSFSLTGDCRESESFILETESASYEGCFLSQADKKNFVSRLVRLGKYRIELNLTSSI